MESNHLAILSSKGQLTVPRPLRERLKLGTGQRLLLEESQGGILIKKASIQEAEEDLELGDDQWKELKRLASAKGKTYRSGRAFLKSLKIK